jgi:hypothetical protein
MDEVTERMFRSHQTSSVMATSIHRAPILTAPVEKTFQRQTFAALVRHMTWYIPDALRNVCLIDLHETKETYPKMSFGTSETRNRVVIRNL